MDDHQNIQSIGNQSIQSTQYSFPYHFIPTPGSSPRLARFWAFSASYIAALELVTDYLKSLKLDSQCEKSIKYVDVGCGDGAFIHHLSKDEFFNKWKMTGIDYDEHALAWARMFTPAVTWVCSDLLEVPKRKFNIASVIEVLEHVDPVSLPSFLDGIASVLTEGGRLIVTVPCVGTPMTEKHFQHFTFQSLHDALKPNFDIEFIYGFESTSWRCRLLARMLYNSRWRIDAPRMNRFLIDLYKKKINRQQKAGRIFCVARKQGSVAK